jgi:hypothetical protein
MPSIGNLSRDLDKAVPREAKPISYRATTSNFIAGSTHSKKQADPKATDYSSKEKQGGGQDWRAPSLIFEKFELCCC